MSVMVTGGLGFLGSAVTHLLLQSGERVLVVDNLVNAALPPQWFSEYEGFECVQTPIESFRPATYDFGEIIHLAGPVGPAGILQFNGILGKTILEQTHAVLELAIGCRVPLLYVSTSEVYGKPGACKENEPCAVPSDPSVRQEYALGKRLSETMVHNRMSEAGLPYSIVRPFNIAGPFQRRSGGFVIPTFFHQALSGSDLTVFGNGRQRRAFGHVDDVAQGILLALRKGPTNQTYNLGNPANSITIGDLALRIAEMAGSTDRIRFVDPTNIHGPLYRETVEKIPDPAKAQQLLGWRPKHGLSRTLSDYLKGLKALTAFQNNRSLRAPAKPLE